MSARRIRGANSAPSQQPLADTRAPNEDDGVQTSPVVADRVAKTTCYMCACRCGIDVHLQDGKVRYIEGNRDHPVNRGVLCGKGCAGIMQHYSPGAADEAAAARRRARLRRVPRDRLGRGAEHRRRAGSAASARTDPEKLAFFTGRDQSQSLTGWWATQFGTPNYAAHGGFCSVNMAAAGLYTIGGSFWEFGEPDWDTRRYFMLFGVAEDHDSNPIKIGLGKLKARGAKIVSVNPGAAPATTPSPTNGSASARAPTACSCCALIHELLQRRQGRSRLSRPLHQCALAGDPRSGRGRRRPVRARRRRARRCAWDRGAQGAGRRAATRPSSRRLPAHSRWRTGARRVPVFQLIAERYLDDGLCARTRWPSAAASRPRRSAASPPSSPMPPSSRRSSSTGPWTDWAGRRHETMIGRPVAMHAMRGISAHSNGFHTCRAIHLLQMLLGTIDVPGGFRYKPPYPKPVPPPTKPAGKDGGKPMTPLPARRSASSTGPDDLLVDDGRHAGAHRQGVFLGSAARRARPDAHGHPQRLGRRSLPHRHAVHVHGQHGWNSSMNTAETIKMLTDKDEDGDYKIPLHHLFRRLLFRDGRLSPIWSCRTRPIWSARTASRCSTGRSADADGPATPSASRWSSPTATCGRSRTC